MQTLVHAAATSETVGVCVREGKVSEHHPTIISQYGSHRGGVHAVQFRPQMKHLVSGGSDNAVYLWSLHCRPNLRHPVVRPYRFLGHQGPVYSVAVSPLDTLVASGSQDRSVRLWIPTVEGKSTTIKGHTGPVRAIAFNHDGQCLLSASDDKTIKIWRVNNQRFLCALSGHMNWIRSVEFSADSRLVLSGSDDKSVRLWDVERHECIQQFSDVLGLVYSTRFHPDNCCIASGTSDHCIQMWDIRSKTLIQHYAANAGAVHSVCFHPSGNYLLSSCDDASLKIWDLREGQIVFTLQGHDGATHSAEFSPSGEYFASGSSDEHILLWRTNVDFTCGPIARGCVTQKNVGHALCSACHCVCTSPPNDGGIHCPHKASRAYFHPMHCTRSPSLCTISESLSTSKEKPDNSAKLVDADELNNNDAITVNIHQSTPEMEILSIVPHCNDGTMEENEDANTITCIKCVATNLVDHRETPLVQNCSFCERSKVPIMSKCDINWKEKKTDTFHTLPTSIANINAIGSTIDNLCHQLNILTHTVALFEERLSNSEKKMTHLERYSEEITPNEQASCNIHS